jgi:hypothetical protein
MEAFFPSAAQVSDLAAAPTCAPDLLFQVANSKRDVHPPTLPLRVEVRDGRDDASPASPSGSAINRACAGTVAAADAALTLLDELDQRHRDIAARTSLLHAECTRLVGDEARMRTTASRIYAPLSYFESVYVIGRRLGAAFPPEQLEESAIVLMEMQKLGITGPGVGTSGPGGWNPHRVRALDLPLLPEDEDFPAALDRLEECLAFIAAHRSWRESAATITALQGVQARAVDAVLSRLRTAVDKVAASAAADLRAATAAIATATASSDPAALSRAIAAVDAVELSSLQLRWRTELAALRPLLSLLETRAGSGKRVYLEATKRAYDTYLAARLSAVSPAASARLCRVVAEKTKGLRVPRPRQAAPPAGAGRSDGSTSSAGSAYTACTATTRGTLLFSEEVGAREACVVDAVRTCAALMARMLSSEHALFHSIFTSAGSGRAAAAAAAREEEASAAAFRSPGALHSRFSSAASVAGSERTFGGGRGSVGTRGTALVGGLPAAVRSAADAALSRMCDDLCGVMTDALRPAILSLDSLDTLVDVIAVLRDEVVREVAAPRGPSLAPLARAATGLLADVRERLAFRAAGFISDYIEGRRVERQTVEHPLLLRMPGSAAPVLCTIAVRGELDYPARLLSYYLRQRTAGEASAVARAASEGGRPMPFDPSLTVPPSVYDSWLPVVEDALLLIAKLHASLEREAFESLARDAVQACARAVLAAGAAVRRAGGPTVGGRDSYVATRLSGMTAPAEGFVTGLFSAAGRLDDPSEAAAEASAAGVTASIDACLLVVSSLLTVREQLSPYDMDPVSTASSLDFGPTGLALSGLLAGLADRSIFTLTSGNPLLGLLSRGLPAVSEQRVDVRAQLEGVLRGAAEEAVAHSTRLLTRHLSALLAAHATPLVGAAGVAAYRTATAAALAKTAAAFSLLLPSLRRRFGLYLGSPTTAAILWRPVREHSAHVLIAVRAHVAEALGAQGEEGERAVEGAEERRSSAAAARAELDATLAGLLSALDATGHAGTDPSAPGFGLD